MSEHTYCSICGTWIFVGYDEDDICQGCRENIEEEEDAKDE